MTDDFMTMRHGISMKLSFVTLFVKVEAIYERLRPNPVVYPAFTTIESAPSSNSTVSSIVHCASSLPRTRDPWKNQEHKPKLTLHHRHHTNCLIQSTNTSARLVQRCCNSIARCFLSPSFQISSRQFLLPTPSEMLAKSHSTSYNLVRTSLHPEERRTLELSMCQDRRDIGVAVKTIRYVGHVSSSLKADDVRRALLSLSQTVRWERDAIIVECMKGKEATCKPCVEVVM
jgi:hypothetical protein